MIVLPYATDLMPPHACSPVLAHIAESLVLDWSRDVPRLQAYLDTCAESATSAARDARRLAYAVDWALTEIAPLWLRADGSVPSAYHDAAERLASLRVLSPIADADEQTLTEIVRLVQDDQQRLRVLYNEQIPYTSSARSDLTEPYGAAQRVMHYALDLLTQCRERARALAVVERSVPYLVAYEALVRTREITYDVACLAARSVFDGRASSGSGSGSAPTLCETHALLHDVHLRTYRMLHACRDLD